MVIPTHQGRDVVRVRARGDPQKVLGILLQHQLPLGSDIPTDAAYHRWPGVTPELSLKYQVAVTRTAGRVSHDHV